MNKFDTTSKDGKALLCSYLSILAYRGIDTQNKWFSKLFPSGYELQVDARKNLQYSIVRDTTNKHLYIAIRGTDTNSFKESISDLLVSLQVWNRKVRGYKLHNGYAKYGKKLLSEFIDIINEHPDHKIIFTGHSLGGVLAKFCAIECDIPCECFTFGAPRLAEAAYYEETHKAKVFNYININDVIPLWYPKYYDVRKNSYILMDSTQIRNVDMKTDKILKPLYVLVKNTLLGSIVIGLESHSIKNYIRHINRIVRKKEQ